MIWKFIFKGRIFPGGGRAFFSRLRIVGFCRYDLHFMAATSISRHNLYGVRVVVNCKKKRRLWKSKPPDLEMARENVSALRRLFFFCRRAADNRTIFCFSLVYQYQLTLRWILAYGFVRQKKRGQFLKLSSKKFGKIIVRLYCLQ